MFTRGGIVLHLVPKISLLKNKLVFGRRFGLEPKAPQVAYYTYSNPKKKNCRCVHKRVENLHSVVEWEYLPKLSLKTICLLKCVSQLVDSSFARIIENV